jgi:hypothetical protein
VNDKMSLQRKPRGHAMRGTKSVDNDVIDLRITFPKRFSQISARLDDRSREREAKKQQVDPWEAFSELLELFYARCD